MKFGRNLPRNQVPEWAASYINYKGLKKLIKNAADTVKVDQDVDLAEFFFSLDRSVEDVDGFYNKKFLESARRLKLLQDRYGVSTEVPPTIDRHEIEELMGALLELRGQLRKLQWYGEVNRRGFIKITKKLDKKVPKVCAQRQYLETRVDPKRFASNAELSAATKTINDWLSNLGEAKPTDDVASVHSSHSTATLPSRALLSLPAGLVEALDIAIRDNNGRALSKLLPDLREMEDGADDNSHQILLNLLQRSIASRATSCIARLLEDLTTLEDEEDINSRNCVHRLIIALGRSRAPGQGSPTTTAALDDTVASFNYLTPASAPLLAPSSFTAKEHDQGSFQAQNKDTLALLEYLLDHLRPEQRPALTARDIFGRFPLHYAAHYGLPVVCNIVIQHMQAWGQYDVSKGIDSVEWQDADGWAPLHLGVIGGHSLTTRALLKSEDWVEQKDDIVAVRRNILRSSAALGLATKANFVAIVRELVEAGVNINYQDDQGEAALHIAARSGHDECAKILLEGTEDQKADTELVEKTFAWTPLFTASVDGHAGIVDLLIEAGSDLERTDLSGWTAKEHAALRGHMDIARKLDAITTAETTQSENSTTASSSPPNPTSLEDRTSQSLIGSNGAARTTAPVKTFGHRYLTNESMVLVSLGTMDPRKIIYPVKLDRIPLSSAHSTQLDTALSVVVSAQGASGEPSVIDLPVQESISTEPTVFTTPDASKVKLLFDIVPTYAGSNEQIVGRAVALLSTIKPSIGSKRITLQGDVSVPIVAANTLEVIGSVNFNFLIITPFTHPNMSINETQTYWKSLTSTMLIGHRGLGKNQPARKSLQLGENTIQSFIAAANLGASYVEFDVQLTKDLVPVIYHDFLVSETGIDAPVHTLTLEQFLHINSGQTPRTSRPTSPVEQEYPPVNGVKVNGNRRSRSLSLSTSKQESVHDLSERMKHTRDFKMKGFKGNSRGNFIQAPFTTLEEMFKKLPQSIGFNIEMKYPMLHESEDHEMDTYAVELNSFVDTVLTKVYDLGKKRNVIFSSFNPDICLLLSFKQPSIPILFLTDAGTCPVGDIRASSLQEAIRFASRWNLLGVVSAAEPLVISPRLVKVVKESGLVCVSYGQLNNLPENVQLQAKEGIDAVIVDSVLAIRQGLTGSNDRAARNTPMSNGTRTNGGVDIVKAMTDAL
ncbi:MAG: Glycerophosphocholine phosphodiesterase [Piccolia ochrophora]|nr:MAG: Glycerophosphocholine phosphodiesterase [Piccolia ochrophora]